MSTRKFIFGQETHYKKPIQRPPGAQFEYTCNKCGKISWNEFHMQIHAFREHGQDDRDKMDIVKRPAWTKPDKKLIKGLKNEFGY